MSSFVFDGKEKDYFVCAIVAAAGNSTRMQGTDKQFLSLDGVPVLAKSISVLEKSDCIDEIIVCVRRDVVDDVKKLVKDFNFTKVVCVCEGGSTRVESVKNAIKNCSEKTDILAIHDGARPFVTEETVRKTVEAACEFGAAACAVKVKDTIKQTNENSVVTSTPPRGSLWAVQTPQVFSFKKYKNALGSAPDGVTDDCMIVEAAGQRVKLVEGEYTNIKITTPDDIIVARAIAKGRGE